MKHDDESSDLLVAARRRPLSREEESELEALVDRSPEARVLHYAGWAFDRDSSAREDDDVLVARMAARAVERAGSAPAAVAGRRRRPLVTLLAAALAVASTAGAGAGVVYLVRAPVRAPEVQAPPASLTHAAPGTTVHRKHRAVPAAAAAAAPVPEPTFAEPAPTPEVAPPALLPPRAPLAHSRAKIAAPDSLSASSLFGEANQKRLAGDTAGAIALYKLLTERHAGSAEADLAELSLGKLLLSSGDGEAALLHFRRAAASGGALGSEALWGQAEAQKALGRNAEERETLERLLALYPDGAYAKAARKRLGTDAP